jgi:hypothetical protein
VGRTDPFGENDECNKKTARLFFEWKYHTNFLGRKTAGRVGFQGQENHELFNSCLAESEICFNDVLPIDHQII